MSSKSVSPRATSLAREPGGGPKGTPTLLLTPPKQVYTMESSSGAAFEEEAGEKSLLGRP